MHAVRCVAVAWLVLVPVITGAQAPAASASRIVPSDPLYQPDRRDPLDPDAPVPALPAAAPFAGYLRYEDPVIAPWRQTNADVTPAPRSPASGHGGHGGHGGHNTHRPEASPAASARPASPAPAPGPAAAAVLAPPRPAAPAAPDTPAAPAHVR